MSTFKENIDDACNDLNETINKVREQLKNGDDETRAKFTEQAVIEWQADCINNLERGVGVAISVVDQSKQAFKSKPLKEMKELREDIEAILKKYESEI